MKIRVAAKEDSAEIGQVHVDSWRSTYKGVVADETLEALNYEKMKRQWNYILSIEGVDIFVAEVDGKIVGYISVGALDQKTHPGKGAINALYLLKDYQRQGIGRALLKAAFTALHEQNIKKVVVEVFEENKTKHFYEKYGALFSYNKQIKMGGKSLLESVYEWPSVEDALEKM